MDKSTDELFRAELADIACHKVSQEAQCLTEFIQDHLRACETPHRDPRTTFIDQGRSTTYAPDEDCVDCLMEHLELCRRANIVQHFSELQGIAAAPLSGIMLDFDIYIRPPPTRGAAARPEEHQLTQRHYHTIATVVSVLLQRDVVLDADVVIHAFFLKRHEIAMVTKDGQRMYKNGLHVVIPTLQLTREYKRAFVNEVAAHPQIVSIMRELGAVEPEACLDKNCVSVPAMLFGSCKRGAMHPYELSEAFSIQLPHVDNEQAGWKMPPLIAVVRREELEQRNLVAEMSLTRSPRAAPLPPAFLRGLIGAPAARPPPLTQRVAPALSPEASARAQAAKYGGVATVGDELEVLLASSADARELRDLLALLPDDFARDYARWRDVLFAVAHSQLDTKRNHLRDNYEPLADWFSRRRPDKYDAAAFMRQWADALARTRARASPITRASIIAWALEADPARARAVLDKSRQQMLLLEAMEMGNEKLRQFKLAQVLHQEYGHKWCAVTGPPGRGGKAITAWWEFVTDKDEHESGELWKWRPVGRPSGLYSAMSRELTEHLRAVRKRVDTLGKSETDENMVRYCKEVLKGLKSTINACGMTTFKNQLLEACADPFARPGFIKEMDTNGRIFGTANGILVLATPADPVTRFIAGPHPYLVSKHSPVAYTPFDPESEMGKRVLKMWETTIPEPDARDWILFFRAQGLDGHLSEGLALFGYGGGANGKTSIEVTMHQTLGDDIYACKKPLSIFTTEGERPEAPNPAVASLNHMRYTYCEETRPGAILNTARFKELVNTGWISTRGLYEGQVSFPITTNFSLSMQFLPIVREIDHGTWRRIFVYLYRIKYCLHPDANNPNEVLADPDYVHKWPYDREFQSAFLGLLVHYYDRLQREYGGKVQNVKSPTIEYYSTEYRKSQDFMHRFIAERIVKSPDAAEEYDMMTVSQRFLEWMSSVLGRPAVNQAVSVEDSALAPYITSVSDASGAHTAKRLRGCRILGKGDSPRPNETYVVTSHQIVNRPSFANKALSRPRWWEPPASTDVDIEADIMDTVGNSSEYTVGDSSTSTSTSTSSNTSISSKVGNREPDEIDITDWQDLVCELPTTQPATQPRSVIGHTRSVLSSVMDDDADDAYQAMYGH